MKPVTIELPAQLVELFGSEEGAKQGAREAIVLDLLRQGRLSRGKAAELLGIPMSELPELLGRYRIPWFGSSTDEVQRDVETLRKGEGRRS